MTEPAGSRTPEHTPAVSVLMPAHNESQFLGAAVESILAQSFADFEFIIVDDGSTDETPTILAEYAARDERIRVLTNQKNAGIISALNRGLDACRGRYVARMDADDVSMKDRLEKQLAVMEAEPDVLALGAALRYIDGAGKDLNVTRHCTVGGSLLYQCPLLHPTVMLRREAIAEHALRYRERFPHGEDYFFWLEISRHGRLSAVDDVVLKYRIRSGATRMKHLKSMLWSTLKCKALGVVRLGIRPTFLDVLRFAAECVLMLIPSFIVRWVYLRKTFGRQAKIDL